MLRKELYGENVKIPEGSLVHEGLSDSQLKPILEHDLKANIPQEQIVEKFGAYFFRYYDGERGYVRNYNDFGPIQFTDQEGRQYRKEDQDLLVRLPKGITRQRSRGSFANQIQFPHEGEILTLTRKDQTILRARVRAIDTAGNTATARVYVEIL